MSVEGPHFQSALSDFNEARLKASLQEVLSRLTGKSNELLSYDEVAQKLRLKARSDRGVKNIPVNSIVGSVGRYTDFTRTFLPRSNQDRERWARVKTFLADPVGTGLPPIEVYKVGEAYFVLDGNHRVSIARQEGVPIIEAHVIEVRSEVPVTPDLDADELILKAEYAGFLDATEIQNLRPNVDLSVTVPGKYPFLEEHIEVHRYFMGLEYQREVPYSEAVSHWYDFVYLPFIEPIRERGLMRWFPGRTETDLYLWVSEHRAALVKELERDIRPELALENLAIKANPRAAIEETKTGAWRSTRLVDRYLDHLFNDVLVPVNKLEGAWPELEQAVWIGQRESAFLQGLHVLPKETEKPDSLTIEAQTRFQQRCQEANLGGKLTIKSGEVAQEICEQALLTDLVVMKISHPPERGLAGLGSGLRTILRGSARPILTVPGEPSPLDRALVAFDGSSKSKEALFLATYLAERWGTALSILTLKETGTQVTAAQQYARAYLEFHEIQAEYQVASGPKEVLLEILRDKDLNLIVLGSYSGTVVQEVTIGSTVNFVLRQAPCPALICR